MEIMNIFSLNIFVISTKCMRVKKNGNWHRIQMGILTSFFKKISLGTTYSYILLTIWPKSKASVQILLLENKWSMLDVGPGHDIIEIILFVCWKINDSNGSPHPTL